MRHTSSFVNCFWLAPFFVKPVLCDLFGTGDTDHFPDDKLGHARSRLRCFLKHCREKCSRCRLIYHYLLSRSSRVK